MTSIAGRRRIWLMTRKSHRMEWSTEVRPDARGAGAPEDDLPVRLDIERIKRSLAAPRHTIPPGLTPEEIRQFILAAARGQK